MRVICKSNFGDLSEGILDFELFFCGSLVRKYHYISLRHIFLGYHFDLELSLNLYREVMEWHPIIICLLIGGFLVRTIYFC